MTSARLGVTFSILVVVLFSSLIPSKDLIAQGQKDQNEEKDLHLSCNCVAFRLDDIQDFFLTSAQMKVINTFQEKNASLTVGVIGNSFGDDFLMLLFLKGMVASNVKNNTGFTIEIANHGWNHEDFTKFSREEQSDLIQQTNKKINDTLNVKPTVFIPPYNSLNNDTIAALLENGFQYVSGNTTSYPPSFLILNQNTSGSAPIVEAVRNSDAMLHFPSSATTGYLNADHTKWLGYSHNSTFAAINASMNELGYAVVTMHPMEFSLRNDTMYQNEIDDEQIRELGLLIDNIRAAGFKIVTISQINEGYNSSIPEFSSYSIYAVLAASIVMVIWLSTKSNRGISQYYDSGSNSASFRK